MDEKNFAENWEQAKARLLKEYPNLSREDLAYEIGKEGELLKKLETKTGKTEKEITDWLKVMG